MNYSFLKRTKISIAFLFLMICLTFGCGSDDSGGGGSGSGDIDLPGNTNTQTDTQTDTDTDTTAVTPGMYHIYEHRNPPCWNVGYFDYYIQVAQEEGSNSALVMRDNQILNCNADNANKILDCTGVFIFESGWSFDYGNYSLMQQPDGDLLGETEYSASYTTNSECSSYSELTTVMPEYGSVHIINSTTSYTFNYVEFLPCGADYLDSNTLDSDQSIEPDHGMYFSEITPDCYDVYVADDRVPTADSVDVLFDNKYVQRAENTILRIIDGDGESNLLRIEKVSDPSQISGGR